MTWGMGTGHVDDHALLKTPEVTWGPETVTFTFDITDEVAALVVLGIPVDVARAEIQKTYKLISEHVRKGLNEIDWETP